MLVSYIETCFPGLEHIQSSIAWQKNFLVVHKCIYLGDEVDESNAEAELMDELHSICIFQSTSKICRKSNCLRLITKVVALNSEYF